MQVHNFNAGPSMLPNEVLYKASKALIDFDGLGMSILEISHRSEAFLQVMAEARQLVRELLQLDEDFEVLFLHGGASTQFMQVPYNLLDTGETAGYLDTGVWANRALKEARLFGNVEVIASSADRNYCYIPKSFTVPKHLKYLHITTNNTIYGTQWHQIPEVEVPLVADMSSDIFSRQLDFNKFALIYAGAQKNMGPAGVTLVVVRKSILGKVSRLIPTMLDYRVHIQHESIYNTPPVFAVYISMLTLRWLKEQGGIAAIEKRNEEKAALLYREIDENPLFKGTADPADRSRMNVCFVMNDPSLEKEFLEFCKKEDIVGIKGHRLVGGFRASIYNAMPIESVEYLVESMRYFARTHG
ncbi:3-phosphoserine/phosphohydroxythreonine transaminase [Thermoflavifilum thermophilum]|uniref:Phosphoserine aminotransferase n=1 Tax=Thermoflavifilum thermophilum TaxID=1393122 RepID=A0A1I7NBE7_9BACT|nr:3-phosphoserine/phosphohydroxythreonine transaminase [Thermoflavifilum thermophilum]SFV31992.1 phosphoserine aminotransferase apoenzyme [Thermoflavifilum thermophilum]